MNTDQVNQYSFTIDFKQIEQYNNYYFNIPFKNSIYKTMKMGL